MSFNIAGLAGQQFAPDHDGYDTWQKQYASSTHQTEHDMNPGLIVVANNIEDINQPCQYAKQFKKAIAIRTGGHQYSGASSTGQDNNPYRPISKTFANPEDRTYFEKGHPELCSHQLIRPSRDNVNRSFGRACYKPVAMASWWRSFGLLGDHVTSLEIFDHDGNEREITKEQDPDLFFAWLGGSPGNMGILTHFYPQGSPFFSGAVEALLNAWRENVPQIPTDPEETRLQWPPTIVVYAQWDAQTMPMSEVTEQWIFRDKREFYHPYVKRTYVTKATNLSTNGWVEWVVDRMDSLFEIGTGQWLSAQLQCFGGKNSQLTRNAGNGTAYMARDLSMCMTIDNFHKEDRKEEAEAWQRVNDQAIGPNGLFSKEDMRFLWGSWGSFDLNANWSAYYDQETYERIRKARKVADPDGIFTPNTFSVKRAE
ncbi:hypothetical protein BKA70DRAFT_1524803 [Coprinopsis sp. MPI-PUGE-AT-0042]|nr:hypothetical protein BKA70DRAFT_1524803 [Coprinopsis sp. MPI-PUGE-AT-0042]